MKAPIAMSSNGGDDSPTKALKDSCLTHHPATKKKKKTKKPGDPPSYPSIQPRVSVHRKIRYINTKLFTYNHLINTTQNDTSQTIENEERKKTPIFI